MKKPKNILEWTLFKNVQAYLDVLANAASLITIIASFLLGVGSFIFGLTQEETEAQTQEVPTSSIILLVTILILFVIAMVQRYHYRNKLNDQEAHEKASLIACEKGLRRDLQNHCYEQALEIAQQYHLLLDAYRNMICSLECAAESKRLNCELLTDKISSFLLCSLSYLDDTLIKLSGKKYVAV